MGRTAWVELVEVFLEGEAGGDSADNYAEQNHYVEMTETSMP